MTGPNTGSTGPLVSVSNARHACDVEWDACALALTSVPRHGSKITEATPHATGSVTNHLRHLLKGLVQTREIAAGIDEDALVRDLA